MTFQILFLPDWYLLAWGELALLITCALFYRVSLHDAWHDKWRNDRRIAEALRTALYSSLALPEDEFARRPASPGESGPATIENALPFYNPGQSWFLGTLKRLIRRERRRFAQEIDWTTDLTGIRRFLADHWLRAQLEYHVRNAHWQHRLARRNTVRRLMVVMLIFAAAVLHGLGVGHGHHSEEQSLLARADVWVGWATIVLPAWAAALHALSSTQDHERLASRSLHMAPMLERLAGRMQAASSLAELQQLVIETEALLDLETQEWAESISERRPEFTG
jgi:hypothetical protein